MSFNRFVKECPGCHKKFNRNRSRKKHILGHTYKNKKGEVFTCRPCPLIPDGQRDHYAHVYRLVDTAPSPTMNKAERAAA